ncbi:hypothetical protein ACHGLA_10505 [Streptomyces sp. YH02]
MSGDPGAESGSSRERTVVETRISGREGGAESRIFGMRRGRPALIMAP